MGRKKGSLNKKAKKQWEGLLENSKRPKFQKRQDEYHKNLPEPELNPDHREDFDKVLKGLIELSPDEQKDGLD